MSRERPPVTEEQLLWLLRQIRNNGGFLLAYPGEWASDEVPLVRLYATPTMPDWVPYLLKQYASEIHSLLSTMGELEHTASEQIHWVHKCHCKGGPYHE